MVGFGPQSGHWHRVLGPREIMQRGKPEVLKLRENHRTRVRMILNCAMVREELFNENVELLNPHFQCNVISNVEAPEDFDTSIDTIQEIIQNFSQTGSNWIFQRDIHLAEYRPLNRSSYIQLPEFIKSRKAVMNFKNSNNQCFKWCITGALSMVEKDPQRITKLLRAQSEKLD